MQKLNIGNSLLWDELQLHSKTKTISRDDSIITVTARVKSNAKVFHWLFIQNDGPKGTVTEDGKNCIKLLISDILTCFAADVFDRAPLATEAPPWGARQHCYRYVL